MSDPYAAIRAMYQEGPLGAVERPYDPPLGPPQVIDGVVYETTAHIQMARSAEHWRSDIEALLVENEMPTECVDAVIALVDGFGMSIRTAIGRVRAALKQ